MRAVDLWNRIIAGDEDAVELLCERYQARFEFICHRRGIPRNDCPDVAQEAVAAAAVQMREGKFRQESSLETWLRRILQFKIADYWRRKGREVASVSIEACKLAEGSRGADMLLDAPDPELPIAVEEALATLPDEHRLLLLLNALEGYTTKEIAGLVGRSEGRVGALLAEAKDMFRLAIRGSKRTEETRGRRRLSYRGKE